jgi:hypothetical protein
MAPTVAELATLDPLTFWFQAAKLLPADPRQASLHDLLLLASAAEGLLRITRQIGEEIDALDRQVKDGATLASIAPERTVLEALPRRGDLARRRLRTYTAAAAEANGITIADKQGGE